jgi:adenosine deaminase
MIVAIGLDSDEFNRPPSLFDEMFSKARADGFHITCHCDVAQKDTHEHIRQVVCTIGGTGGERIDHGLNAAEKPELISMILDKGVGMTICPWAYLRHEPVEQIFPRIRILYDAGIKIAIASDDPAYMEDSWIMHNMLLTKYMCGFQDEDMAALVRYSVAMCWAEEYVKDRILRELETVVKTFGKSLL